MAIRNLSEVEKAWLAALIDGEGCMKISRVPKRRRYTPYITIANCNYSILSLASKLIGCGSIGCKPRRDLDNHRVAYTYAIKGKKVSDLSAQIYPYLVIKREQSVVLMQWPFTACGGSGAKHRLYNSTILALKQEEYEKMKLLNARGIDAVKTDVLPFDHPFLRERTTFGGGRMTEAQKAWLAALIDGEGCISCAKKTGGSAGYRTRIMISNCNYSILALTKRLVGGGCINRMQARGKRLIYQYEVNHSMASNLCAAIYPYLVVKREQALILMDWPAGSKAGTRGLKGKLHNAIMAALQQEEFEQLRLLNARGRDAVKLDVLPFDHPFLRERE